MESLFDPKPQAKAFLNVNRTFACGFGSNDQPCQDLQTRPLRISPEITSRFPLPCLPRSRRRWCFECVPASETRAPAASGQTINRVRIYKPDHLVDLAGEGFSVDSDDVGADHGVARVGC